ncbi:MAG: hypothetical protein JNL10_22465 [Verrucomicrobiales bacterium]|nr:hypothetical protein [Verrucomicrobiales bacterium]
MFIGKITPVLALATSFFPLHAASITALGSLPGEVAGSTASFISADGRTVVGTGVSSGSGFRWRDGILVSVGNGNGPTCLSSDGGAVAGRNNRSAFIWTEGPARSLGTLPGRTSHFPSAISADGAVVVGNAGSPGVTQAFVWRLSTGVMQALPDLPGSTGFSGATAVSGDGRIIAGYSSANGRTEAVVWEAGVLKNLSAASAARDSRALHVSEDGATVVGSSDHVAFLYRDGVFQLIGDLPGGDVFSSPQAISADGSTVVGSSSTAQGNEAFRWKDGVMLALGELAGGDYSSGAVAVSADGSVVVGQSQVSDSNAQAFLWTASHGMVTLENLLRALGVDLTGWSRLRVARDISRDGRYICGTGVRNGGLEAFLVDLGIPAVPALAIESGADGRTVRMRFSGEPGRAYRLQRATVLGAGGWGSDQVLVAGNERVYEAELPVDAATGLFRVVAE